METDYSKTMAAGMAAARVGNMAQADALFAAVLRDHPDDVQALVWRGAVTPDPDNAIALLERAVTLDPANTRAQSGLRWAYSRQNAAAPTDPAPSIDDMPTPRQHPAPAAGVAENPIAITPAEITARRLRARRPAASLPTPRPVNRTRPARPTLRRARPTPVRLLWPMALCVLAVALALLSFPLPLLAPPLAAAALLAALAGIWLLGRVAF